MRIDRLFLVPALAATFTLGACTAEQTEEGEMPDVDVSAEGGNLPEYDVEPAQVEVSADTQQIVTPDVDVEPATP